MNATNMTEALQHLSQLHADGKLTDEEFTLAKRRIIDASVSATPSVAPTTMPNALQKLDRSLTDRWIGGVCGGLAVATAIPTWAWRILFVLMIFLNGLGLLMYLLMLPL